MNPGNRINSLNIDRLLSGLGYTNIEKGGYIAGLPGHFHIPEQSALITVIDERGFLYDNQTPRCQVALIKKCAESSGLNLYIVNKDLMWSKKGHA